MLAHFLFFVYWISHMVVFCIASLFAKLTSWQDHDMINENNGTYVQTMGRIATFFVPSLTWLMTKYRYYYLSLNLLFLKLTTMVSSIAYFYSVLNSGDHMLMVLKRNNLKSNLYLAETLDHTLIRQWQLTVTVFNFIASILKIFLDVAYPNMQICEDSFLLHFMLGVLFSQVLFSICKTYLDIFVQLDKI